MPRFIMVVANFNFCEVVMTSMNRMRLNRFFPLVSVFAIVIILAPFSHAQSSSGTGFIIHPDGYILTCNHVIKGGGTIEVILHDSTKYKAQVVEADAYKDLALLKITGSKFPTVPLGDSERVRVLDTIIALGYPLASIAGNEVAANEGKINAKRDSEKIPLFQIDAAVNPGNCGGPLVNDRGEVVGIVVAKLNALKFLVLTGTIPEGINFAIPILYAKSLLKNIPSLNAPTKPPEKMSPQDIYDKISPATVRILINDSEGYEIIPPSSEKPPQPVKLETITIPLPNLPKDAKPLEMVLIPAGTFMMGSPESEKNRGDWEGPQHKVTITKPFFMGKYEVTQAQWQAVMGNNPAHFKGINNPVEQVSWDDCQAFIKKLNQINQGTFRLPTEAEWEYACRAGTTTRFYWGNDLFEIRIGEYAWYANNSGKNNHEVGIKKPNAWGLYDMSGNIWEWCQDWYGSYSFMSQNNPTSANSGEYRVYRGGGWGNIAGDCRSADRLWGWPDNGSSLNGFRVCRTK